MQQMARQGVLFLVVGPSGVGKDTLLDGVRAALGGSRWFCFPRRFITRPADAGGEAHLAVSEASFGQMATEGAFLHSWQAHGLSYGVSTELLQRLAQGQNVVLNTSRRELAAFAGCWPRCIALHVTASATVLADRLHARGRETDGEIAARLAQSASFGAGTMPVIEVRNDAEVASGVRAMMAAIIGAVDLHLTAQVMPVTTAGQPLCLLHRDNPVSSFLGEREQQVDVVHGDARLRARVGMIASSDTALIGPDDCGLPEDALHRLGARPGDTVTIHRRAVPQSRGVLRRKIRGEELSAPELEMFFAEVISGHYSDAEIAGFLVAAAGNLSDLEVADLVRIRAGFADRQHWDAPVVVDKHSMGGIPGNRITPLVIPIVAAHGLVFPKTSSRAITSAAGTADAMEVLARVDLTAAEMRAVVGATGACIAWNGRLTHSPVDEVMNAINRPLGLRSARLDVSSILSKKLAAGSTHVLIDIPVGPQAKTRTHAEAGALAGLFVSVGEAVGLKVRVELSDGRRAIGRGIGPALEMRDVLEVLRGDPGAPADLREKALHFSASLIGWAEGTDPAQARSTAEALLTSGRANEKFWQIIDAQGRRAETPQIGTFAHDICAGRSGRLKGHCIAALSQLARLAGAPLDHSAGLDILCLPGEHIEAGQPVLRLHAGSEARIESARREAALLKRLCLWEE